MDHIVYSPKTLGLILQSQRKSKKLNQAQSGKAFGIDQTTVSSIEQGAPGTRLETLFRMLAALGLEMVIRPRESTDSTDKDRW